MGTPYKNAVLATAGLVALWPLDEPSGSVAADANGGANNGVYTSITQGQTSLLPNGEGKCATFSPPNSVVGVPTSAALNPGDVFTIEGIVATNTVSAANGIMSKGNGGYFLRIDGLGRLELLKSQIASICTANTAMTVGSTNHVAATKNGATVKLYLNGVDVTGGVANSTIGSTGSDLNIGGDSGFAANRWDGRMQDMALYNTALSQATISAHVAAMSAAAGAATLLSLTNVGG